MTNPIHNSVEFDFDVDEQTFSADESDLGPREYREEPVCIRYRKIVYVFVFTGFQVDDEGEVEALHFAEPVLGRRLVLYAD